ncbi:fatty acyl-AMP ligase [Algoriphagus sp. AK58]|uniref:fatty acyl-AMP ligase n=1 Tax=Algoriphagus sp. AK58 TaxID=1406877 RepID=UPI001C9CF147|nr:fatty acyl-AMP ligase [Algoriphagus sp. AK58]
MPKSLVDILCWRAKYQADTIAYRFLIDGEFEEESISYQELDRRVRSFASCLQEDVSEGERALILLPAGIDFIVAYFACLYAKIIAVPVFSPHSARLEASLENIFRIAENSKPASFILSRDLLEAIQSRNSLKQRFLGIKLLAISEEVIRGNPENWRKPTIEGEDIAFLQYTSGSTNAPKGVMVTHQNLLHNLAFIQEAFGQTGKSRTVIWLPPYHDMGLIGGILQPLYTGNEVTLLPHLMFLQRPFRWLEAITRFKATTSGGPNFAYELCLKKIRPEQREILDLSSWEVAFNGAEPINPKTLDEFSDFFAPCGFRKEAFLPCYGLAEATLLVSGSVKSALPKVRNFELSGLEKGKVLLAKEATEGTKRLVSCGPNRDGQEVKIVDFETLLPCESDRIGEIWVSGPSVAKGYWHMPSETAATFEAKIAGAEDRQYLRTGDLGFLLDEDLFVAGRIKNLIIVDGKNHYAHDIEKTVEHSHPSIWSSGCAVFSIEVDGKERVVVVAEVQPKLIESQATVIRAIRNAISESHQLPVHEIKLTLPGTIPRTTSGKIKHFLCKKNYLLGVIKEIVLT